MSIIFLLSGLYMGWSLGANDPSHIFGTAVVTNMIKYRTVIILLCIFLCLGAALQGAEGLSTLKSIASQTEMSAFVAAFIAASTVLLMVKFNLPASTSQAMLGAIIGIGFVNCNANLSRVPAIMASWVLTPAGCAVISMILYPIFSAILKKAKLSDKKYDRILKAVVIISGCYGSYSLGANNLANVTGVYYGTLLTLNQAIWIGAISICLGVITYSKVVTDKVMKTVGKELVQLTPYGATIAVIAMAVVMQIYAVIGIPVSSAQALVGGSLGIGLIKREKIGIRPLVNIFIGWITTPLISCVLCYGIYFVIKNWIGYP